MAVPRRRRAGRPSAAVSAETRTRILRAACERFAIFGYGRARNREIAEAAGVTSAALYHYYDSKAELFAAVYRDGLELVMQVYREAAAAHSGAVAKLCAMVETNVALNRAHPGLADFFAVAPLELRRHPELAALAGEAGREVPELFREVLAGGVRTGELRADLPVDTVVHLVTAASYGLSWSRALSPGGGARRGDARLPGAAPGETAATRRRGRGGSPPMTRRLAAAALLAAALGCTQETQNELGRSIQNWTGTDGVLEIYAGEKLVKRFLEIDKLSTALGTADGGPRAYRFGYGIYDENLNGVRDPSEQKVYFEVGGFATYVFFENPR